MLRLEENRALILLYIEDIWNEGDSESICTKKVPSFETTVITTCKAFPDLHFFDEVSPSLNRRDLRSPN